MRLRDLVDESVIKIGLESQDKEECFEELLDLLVRAGRLDDRAGALQAIEDREAIGTTGIGGGVAIPHAKHESIERLVAAMGTSPDGIEFDAVDDQPVTAVFLLLAPTGDPGPHVRTLAEIARLVQTPGFCRKLIEADTPADVLNLLDAEE